ncbi:hypothetical protein NDU88_004682 [Pleurodeles waltl]|uniref:Uncharacterized protein n=1 Tax=Pleurodeles waltl TaxID=8319 RepID=A0AAV7L247_PLEWA|nr:hypothetical protein NDU88_004682 [Pleurodeles waltl]
MDRRRRAEVRSDEEEDEQETEAMREEEQRHEEDHERPLREREKASTSKDEHTAFQPSKLGIVGKESERATRSEEKPRDPQCPRRDVPSSGVVLVAGQVFL